MWVESQKTRPKLTPELVPQEMRSRRHNANDMKLFKSHKYSITNQIKYQFRKSAVEYEVTAKEGGLES